MEAKKIIITGGATRVGAAIARKVSRRRTDITNPLQHIIIKSAKKLKAELDEFG